ncbi:phosphoinositide phosphatase SAC2-like isoform X3 [Prosopis cineraria]|uniref:phosphoinositide phosphatase SAC2-like isoform X3 n=1 Tax=Prosopis cineraria TaxID=364024 RepID=UPI00240EAAA7|nr:phosphoinositide phosphatase SAC2-like isoform X3 [Prosopis cineraria]
MELAKEKQRSINDGTDHNPCIMQKFKLYETRSKFYMIGRDKSRTSWRVLKIDRSETAELNITEDSMIYSEIECCDLLRRIHEGNRSTGGLKFVTTCYGIIGFIKFLEPYYMLLITKRRKIGTICGHTIYTITKSEMIPVPHPSVRSKMAYPRDENRYKKLLCSVDLRKDFFFSYSYHIMRSLQKNFSDNGTSGHKLYETMFVWNEFLTREIRNNLQNTSWTVALVHGFFKQVKLSIFEREFYLTIIARRSRHYAGTRYLKRGVNEKGRVANDVETEQIVFEDAQDGCPIQISSVVQMRGSIPLFWSQEASPLNMKPDILLSKEDHNFEATRLHFENLVKRYGNPIIILNLIKTREKKPRETILRAEFANAVRSINKTMRGENHLRFLHWDLNRHSKCKTTNVLTQLGKVAAYALKLTGIFCCQVTPNVRPEGLLQNSLSENNIRDFYATQQACINEDTPNRETKINRCYFNDDVIGDYCVKPWILQSGVLRTNCIDCLDRTNVAQYAYGLTALGRQLQALRYLESPYIDFDNPLAMELMAVYESMGDTLAFQYGGSAAHNKIFSERRGQWKAAAQSQEFIRTLQRYYNNTYLDGDKQNAINIFLGHFLPQQGKPALWELDSDQSCIVAKHGSILADDNIRSTIKRSLSDGNIVCGSDSIGNMDDTNSQHLSEKADDQCLSESDPDVFTCGSDICQYRQMHRGVLEGYYCESDHICYDEHGDACDCSNFLDVDWLSSSGNSCEEELLERSTSISSENIANELRAEATTSANESGPSMRVRKQSVPELNKAGGYAENFSRWITYGEMLYV